MQGFLLFIAKRQKSYLSNVTKFHWISPWTGSVSECSSGLRCPQVIGHFDENVWYRRRIGRWSIGLEQFKSNRRYSTKTVPSAANLALPCHPIAPVMVGKKKITSFLLLEHRNDKHAVAENNTNEVDNSDSWDIMALNVKLVKCQSTIILIIVLQRSYWREESVFWRACD